jgi:hypothetical protein
MFLTYLREQFSFYGEHLNRLVSVGIVEIRILVRLVEQDADLAEVRAIRQNTVLVKALLVHDVDLATDQKVDVARLLVSLLDNWVVVRIQVIVVFLLFLVILVFVLVEEELGVQDDLAFKLVVTIFEHEFEDLIVIVKYLIKHLYLQSWLQYLENLSMLDLHSIVAEFHRVKAPDTLQNQVRQMLILASFVQRNQPVINLLLLIIKMVLCLNVTE